MSYFRLSNATAEAVQKPELSALHETEKPLDRFAEDVIEAERAATATRRALPALLDPAAEIWPAMRVRRSI